MYNIKIKGLSTILAVLVFLSSQNLTYSLEKTVAPLAGNIIISNNAGIPSTIKVSGLNSGDVVKVYGTLLSGIMIKSAVVPLNKTECIISIFQLGYDAGTVYLSVTGYAKLESDRTAKDFDAVSKTNALSANNITIVNNVQISDTIKVTGLKTGDVINVFSTLADKILLGTASVLSGRTDCSMNIADIGTNAGEVYLSVTSIGKLESDRVQKLYDAEIKQTAPLVGNITIINNSGISDTIKVTGLIAGDVVKLYSIDVGGSPIGTARVDASKTECAISVSQLGVDAGTAYITVTRAGKFESDRSAKTFDAELKSSAPLVENVTITNNAGIPDTIKIIGLDFGDIVKIYSAVSGGTSLAFSKVLPNKTDCTITIPQLAVDSGFIYISKTSIAKQESDRIEKTFVSEVKSASLSTDSITITNNSGISDLVKITDLQERDIIKLYTVATGGLPISTITVLPGKTEANVSNSQLGGSSGSIFVTITNYGKLESDRVEKTFDAETKSAILAVENISIINNAKTSDYIKVIGLKNGDVIKAYDLLTGGNNLSTSKVQGSNTECSLSVSQLGSLGGSIFISITNSDKLESDRVEKTFGAETKSDAPLDTSIIITNNSVIADTIKVTGLVSGDIIRAYAITTGGSIIGVAKVETNKTECILSINQIGTSSGTVYVTLTNPGKIESDRTAKAFDGEVKSIQPLAENVTFTNNAGSSDIITISNLLSGDLVKVYTLNTDVSPIGLGKVAIGKTVASINITQVGLSAGSVFISVTSIAKLESDKTEFEFSAEDKSVAIDVDSITITNNAGAQDTIKLTDLTAGDVIKIYSAITDGVLIGSGKVEVAKTQCIISFAQLGLAGGSVYVSLTSKNKLESDRTQKDFSPEAKSSTPDNSKILVINNPGTADIIIVYGLSAGTTVKLYSTALKGNDIGKSVVATKQTQVVIQINKLEDLGGNIYITQTNVNKLESDTTTKGYDAE